MASALSISGTLATPQGTTTVQSLTITGNATDLIAVSEVLLGSGSFTAFAVPTWAEGVLIQPGSGGSSHTTKFKMLTGDTGANISPTNPTVIALDNSNLPADIYLESSGTDANYTTVTFF
jgi:hypothetical protein